MKQKHAVLLIEFSHVAMQTGNHSVEFHVLTLVTHIACLRKANYMATVIDGDILLVLFFCISVAIQEIQHLLR